jgi:DNA transformation protein
MADGDRDIAQGTADRLVAMGPVVAKHMFGGYGLFLDGTMFGLVWRGTVYFKVGEANRAEYARARSRPFAYRRGDDTVEMSYSTVPEKVLAEATMLVDWAARALDVARAKRARPRRRR